MLAYKELDVEQTIASLSLHDKVQLISGADVWHFVGLPHAGIGSVRVSDGPNGVRGCQFFNGTPASCFPCSTGLGSSFDIDLARAVGQALADEARAKGAHVLLGPTVNTLRNPLGGRGFESFSEDPVLNGLIAASYVNGLQEKGVAATMKHFVANDQEFERFSSDSIVQERALREVYLEPFRLIVKHASPRAVMTSYNVVNGVHASENKYLLDDILRKEWGWDGLVMSDWTGVYSVEQSIKAGLDVEMPGPGVMRGAAVYRVLQAGKLTEEDIDERVKNVLNLHNYAVRSGIPFSAPEKSVDTPELRALLRKAASSSIVLLKNSASLLPLTPTKGQKIAVIGPNAFTAQISGGGSAEVNASYRVSPLQGIRAVADSVGAQVTYAMGAAAYRFVPTIDPYLAKEGLKMEFFNEEKAARAWHGQPESGRWFDKAGEVGAKPDWDTITKSASFMLIDGFPTDIVGQTPYIRVTSTFTPTVSGPWIFGVTSGGEATVFLEGELLIDNNKSYVPSETFFGKGSLEQRKMVPHLEEGKEYKVEVRMHVSGEKGRDGPFTFAGALKLGAIPFLKEEAAIKEAIEVAKASDVAIVVVGLNQDWESEGFDRKTIDLPGSINTLVSSVLAANPNTVVVNQSGTPVSMPWIDQAPAVVQAFYGGNELGNGLADVLFGKVNASGKLAVTFPKRLEDCNTYESFGITTPTPGKVYYTEGIYVGYKHFDAASVEPLFAFGHGLSYTTFSYSSLVLSPVSEKGAFSVSITVSNTGKLAGAEAVQVYISDLSPAIPKVVRELKGFTKVFLQPNESKTVTLQLDRDAFRYWDERHAEWRAEVGRYQVLVGSSSRDVKLSGNVALEKALRWRGL
ncbi:glycoside hydrolase family 3 protein [Calocera viscosa TUFC12733]|uniref:beta-glucosidase n=1 Tax=Calocera viscosa (strain TUFC12733) TaxID=1330018 RepID=A0A167M8V4_CALVF|nr:glycoside hydrolase family 3 protein [Calocera viscosa TUFC12733]